MNISGPRASNSPGTPGARSASVFGSTMRSSAAPINGSVGGGVALGVVAARDRS